MTDEHAPLFRRRWPEATEDLDPMLGLVLDGARVTAQIVHRNRRPLSTGQGPSVHRSRPIDGVDLRAVIS
ncbi:MAG: hypothetical protein CL908_12210 [Deltaproteobacteria bacterium]|nr:hypothetical protein [Deltaproteobacteria bacterium]